MTPPEPNDLTSQVYIGGRVQKSMRKSTLKEDSRLPSHAFFEWLDEELKLLNEVLRARCN